MAVDWSILVQIASPIIGAGVGIYLKSVFEKRPRVVAFLQHVAMVRLEQDGRPGMDVGSHAVVLRNGGGKAAINVRLGHNVLPAFKITPDVAYSISPLPGGGCEILIPSLIPKKQITIAYLYAAPLRWEQVNTHLETDEGPIKVLSVLPSVQLPKWLIFFVWAFAGVGFVASIYFCSSAFGLL